jgi:hypothetical protein
MLLIICWAMDANSASSIMARTIPAFPDQFFGNDPCGCNSRRTITAN